MIVNASCPISGDQRDNNAVRVVAGFTLLLALAAITIALTVGPGWAAGLSGLLALDFIIRAFLRPRFSPLATAARVLVNALKWEKQPVDAAPKVFAARIGVVFTATATVLFALGLTVPGVAVSGLLVVFALLESALSFCAGCWLYSLLPRSVGNILAHQF
ncbi:MAG: DUF4395 domain-containing protein [Propionibacteriaceae bacterium]|jgi:hypothetical protein|nr:DUF4395 domain-containing protein [Propionibacteriaceae bacterium]